MQAEQTAALALPARAWGRLGRRLAALAVAALLVPVLAYWTLRQFYPYPYRALIEQSATEFKLDPLLVAAIVRVESNFRPDASSAMGAVGLMQLMPATGRWAARRMAMPVPPSGPDLGAPAVNVRIGCWYLRYLWDRHGDLDAVLAAYNGGEANIPRWRAASANPKEIAVTYPETREFLRRCHTTYKIYRFLYGPASLRVALGRA